MKTGTIAEVWAGAHTIYYFRDIKGEDKHETHEYRKHIKKKRGDLMAWEVIAAVFIVIGIVLTAKQSLEKFVTRKKDRKENSPP